MVSSNIVLKLYLYCKVKSVRKLSEYDVVTQKAQYKIQYKYSFSTILEYTKKNTQR